MSDRSEVKYIMPIEVLPHFLPALAEEYSVLRVEQTPISTYEVTYFDTPRWEHYMAHHNGYRRRSKYRFRRYLESDTAFLEIKLKEHKRRTIKQRIPWDEGERSAAVRALDAGLGEALSGYRPALYVNYRRMSFWKRNTDERLTLDFGMRFQRPGAALRAELPDIFIAEVKQPGKFHGSTFFRRAKSYGYLPVSISKYCVGVCVTGSGDTRSNRFKPMLRRVGSVARTGASNP